jgi:c-di-GMP-binding flagellar brake protein YcgR
MLRSSVRAVSPEIQKLIDEIINTETRFIMSERRDATRTPLTRAVKIRPCTPNSKEFSGITRDISNRGIGLVGQVNWEVGVVAKIAISRLQQNPCVLVAECRWCDNFADGWFLSGWNFLRMETP